MIRVWGAGATSYSTMDGHYSKYSKKVFYNLILFNPWIFHPEGKTPLGTPILLAHGPELRIYGPKYLDVERPLVEGRLCGVLWCLGDRIC